MSAEPQASIRPLCGDDRADVARIASDRALWRDWLAAGVPSADGPLRLARTDARARVVGLLWCNVAGDWFDLCDLVVAAPARQQGHARALMRHTQQAAFLHGATGITLEVAVDNDAACALYRELGFAAVHRRPGYYGLMPRAVDALVMSWRCAR